MKSTGYAFKARSYMGSAEPPATVLEDESRFGNDGTFVSDGNPDWVQLPSGLWIMDFDTTDDFVGCGSSIVPLGGSAWSDFTAMLWIKRTEADDLGVIGDYVHSGGNAGTKGNFGIIVNANHTVRGYTWHDDTATPKRLLSTATLTYEEWVMLTMVSESLGTTITLYENGAVLETGSGAGSGFADGTTWNTRIGGMFGYYAECSLALPRIYNYALGAGKVKQIFESTRHWFGV